VSGYYHLSVCLSVTMGIVALKSQCNSVRVESSTVMFLGHDFLFTSSDTLL